MFTAKSIKGLALAATLTAAAFAQASVAEAGHRHNHRYYNNGGAALAAGVAGVILGSALAAPRYPVYIDPPVYRERVYIDPAPVYVEPGYDDPYYDGPYYDDPYYEEDVYVEPVQPYRPRSVSRPAPVTGTDPLVTKGIGDDEVYYQPGKGPKVVTLDEQPAGRRYAGTVAAGSADWVAQCRARYRSFDVRTGTYLGYDGIRKACVIR